MLVFLIILSGVLVVGGAAVERDRPAPNPEQVIEAIVEYKAKPPVNPFANPLAHKGV